ncbi:hypothetical protein niasHS_003532 [Heterodera schachtii]|uniref:Uncharacterized protein n=1 Tax=Heterodera schachtii TaxID=97005 RepID=A0ABD2KGS2_HETSC
MGENGRKTAMGQWKVLLTEHSPSMAVLLRGQRLYNLSKRRPIGRQWPQFVASVAAAVRVEVSPPVKDARTNSRLANALLLMHGPAKWGKETLQTESDRK